MDENTDLFHGKWVAVDGDRSYEIIFKRGIIPVEQKDGSISVYWEMIIGDLTYKVKGDIVRYVDYDGVLSIFSSKKVKSNRDIEFLFHDRGRKIRYRLDFIIDNNDPKKAILKFGRAEGPLLPGWNDQRPDIPDGMTWTKVE